MESKITLNDFKLSCELIGHSSDVRTVATYNENIISGSRDKTTKIWKRERDEQYIESLTLQDHTNYVSCVFYMKDMKWICTASNDSTIILYKEDNYLPFEVIKGHKSTVCCLSQGIQPNQLISGSWDQTARIWNITEAGYKAVTILDGHPASVWAVALFKSEFYATGCADKNIYIWKMNGEQIKILKGHTDCVRGLISLPDGSLVSCGNDAALRWWNSDGECIRELFGHGNFIYDMALNPDLGDHILVSCSEDSTIRLWDLTSGPLGDSIKLPAQSVWSVCCLKNGDIVTGSSDGVVRIFTRNKSRFASQEIQSAYNANVYTFVTQSNKELGGIKHKDLPGPDSLLKDGKEGDTRIVRQTDGKVCCYEWKNNKWNLIGDVIGATGGTQENSGKTLYEGKEYDFVFSVDISDENPPIKLPYNKGEDPWHVAQNFIHKNALPQGYLDQVADFIIKNSNYTPVQTTNSGFEDPFTGGSRYVPTSRTNTISNDNSDPFTGSSSYKTNSNGQTSTKFGIVKHFPFKSYLTLDKCDPLKILEKLKEFNAKSGDGNIRMTDYALEAIIKLTEKDPLVDQESIKTLQELLKWPKEILFPVLDVTRLAVRNETITTILIEKEYLDIITENLKYSPPNQLMAIRCFANMFTHSYGREKIEGYFSRIFESISNIKQGSANLQIAIATLFLNMTVKQLEFVDPVKCITLIKGLINFLNWCVEEEAWYRALQAIGNITNTPNGNIASTYIYSADNLYEKIKEISESAGDRYEKISECAQNLLSTFKEVEKNV